MLVSFSFYQQKCETLRKTLFIVQEAFDRLITIYCGSSYQVCRQRREKVWCIWQFVFWWLLAKDRWTLQLIQPLNQCLSTRWASRCVDPFSICCFSVTNSSEFTSRTRFRTIRWDICKACPIKKRNKGSKNTSIFDELRASGKVLFSLWKFSKYSSYCFMFMSAEDEHKTKSKYCFLYLCSRYPLWIVFGDTPNTHQGTREKKHNKKHLTHRLMTFFFFIFPLFEIKIWNMSKGQKGSSGQKCEQKLIMSVRREFL